MEFFKYQKSLVHHDPSENVLIKKMEKINNIESGYTTIAR